MMRDWWEYIFSSFCIWLGTCILFGCVAASITTYNRREK